MMGAMRGFNIFVSVMLSVSIGTVMFWWLDARPVQRDGVTRIMTEQPMRGGTLEVTRSTVKLRDCPVATVEMLVPTDEGGDLWVLRDRPKSPGRVDIGPAQFILRYDIPKDMLPGRYVHQFAWVFWCNPLFPVSERAQSAPFEIR